MTTAFQQNTGLTAANTLDPVTDLSDIESVLVSTGDIDLMDLSFTGAPEAISLLPEGFTISEISGDAPVPTVSIGPGIFLTSGGAPGTANTEPGFSVSHYTPGDPMLDATVQAAFDGAGATYDAALLTFTFDSADLNGAPSISLDVLFGSDEFPEFANSSYVDIAAVYVNGVNYALFNGDPNQPLSIVGESINSPGNFFSNNYDDGTDGDPFTGTYDVEYDGFSTLLNIIAPVQDGINTITIAIADTGDNILDSGLFVGNMHGTYSTVSGSYVPVTGTDENDMLEGNAAPQIYTIGEGQDTVTGTADELNGDVIDNFGDDDSLIVEEATFGAEDVTVTMGSAILDIDVDGDGLADTTVTLEGDFTNASFSFSTENGNTEITAEGVVHPGVNLLGTADGETLQGTSLDDSIAALAGNDLVYGLGGDDMLDGGDANDFVDGGEGDDSIMGGQGNDSLLGREGNDTVDGGNNHDNIALHEGDDLAYGGLGNDSIGGGDGDDTIYGDSGNDVIGGGTGNDLINAGGDQDEASGGYGDDTVNGGAGDDTLAGSFGSDLVDGGDGDDSMGGGLGIDTLIGGNGNDSIGAGGGDDFVYGDAGDDFLAGGQGNDLISGGDGSDRLNGGAGDDTLTGGSGADTFMFNYLDPIEPGEVDVITDFEDGIDMIEIPMIPYQVLTITDVEGGALIDLQDTGRQVLVEGVTASMLTEADFI